MTQRDELAALIRDAIAADPNRIFYISDEFGVPAGDDLLPIADAVLARYRLEEREPPRHDVYGWEPIGIGAGGLVAWSGPLVVNGVLICHTCREPWPCITILQRNPPR